MEKSVVLAKLEEYKDRPIEICLSAEGSLLYSGIEGHWLFVKDDALVEIRKNVPTGTGTTGYTGTRQTQNPFIVTSVGWDAIVHVRIFMGQTNEDIVKVLDGLEPVGTTKSMEDITKEIEGDSIRKAVSTRGYLNSDNVAPGSSYGSFKGTTISTDIDGIPQYIKDSLLKNKETQ